MSNITHRFIKTNGINMHVAEAGSGPVVLLLHGFPDFWFTWRYQIPALANAGFRAVAPDIRGFGQTDAPLEAEKYTVFDITGDLIGLIDALGEKKVFVVGHDWGAEAAWALALFRPDRVIALLTVSVPYTPRQDKGSLLSIILPRLGEGWYMAHFQKPGHAEAELARLGLSTFLREAILSSQTSPLVVPVGKTLADVFGGSTPFTSWFTADDLDQYVEAFKRSGLTGPLNVYRAIQRECCNAVICLGSEEHCITFAYMEEDENFLLLYALQREFLALTWELQAPYTKAPITTPAFFIAGSKDVVWHVSGTREYVEGGGLKHFVPNLRGFVVLESGHFIHQEKHKQVNELLIKFLQKELQPESRL